MSFSFSIQSILDSYLNQYLKQGFSGTVNAVPAALLFLAVSSKGWQDGSTSLGLWVFAFI